MDKTGFFIEMNQKQILKLISCIDLTSLGNSDNEQLISSLIEKANSGFMETYPAAVCTYSNYSDLIIKQLNPKIKSAVVAGYFPSGQASLGLKEREYQLIAKTDVDEVDIVINRGELMARNYEFTKKEIALAREILTNKTLKVIIESGDLNSEEIATASHIAIDNGADFIKTSTGKGSTGATVEAAEIMCNEIKKSKKTVGFKASGGIKTLKDAILYSKLVSDILGEHYQSNNLFRIGASSLFDDLISEYNKHD